MCENGCLFFEDLKGSTATRQSRALTLREHVARNCRTHRARTLARTLARTQGVLTRVAERIRIFAKAQRDSVKEFENDIPGGKAGQLVTPVDYAGCYAPGGRYPLPSSVLMTAVTARVAGVREVWVANPRPDKFALAAAHIAGADGFLKIGGAHAIGALAQGVGCPPCNIIVGPGNQWVTAAKSIVQGKCAIDMLAVGWGGGRKGEGIGGSGKGSGSRSDIVEVVLVVVVGAVAGRGHDRGDFGGTG